MLIIGISFFIFSISIDGLYLGYFEHLMVLDRVLIDESLFYIWTAKLLAFLVFAIIINPDPDQRILLLNKNKLKRIGYILFCISLIAASINTYRAITSITVIDILYNIRAWELAFGENALINYLYFLHVVSATIFAVLYKYEKRKLYLFIIFISIFISVLHSIKFTILHAVAFPFLAYFLLNNYQFKKSIIYLSLSIVLSFLMYFQFIRGGGLEGVSGYLFSPTVQATYSIQNQERLANSPGGVIYPDLSNIKRHIFNRLGIGIGNIESNNIRVEQQRSNVSNDDEHINYLRSRGFLLNNKYNISSPMVYISFYTALSYFIPFIFLALLINYIRSKTRYTFLLLFIETYILVNTFLLFWGWKFFDIKMIFLVIVSVFLILSIELKFKDEFNIKLRLEK